MQSQSYPCLQAGGRSQAGGAPDAAASAFAGWSYEELVERKVEIEARHERLTGAKNPAAILANSESIVPKRQETHFDFVMKEMVGSFRTFDALRP
jgi:hypothetical protein